MIPDRCRGQASIDRRAVLLAANGAQIVDPTVREADAGLLCSNPAMAVDIRFEGRGAALAGELVLPGGPGPHPAAVLLQGTGGGTRPYLRAHADAFAAEGVAAFIFDRRGEGDSTGEHNMDVEVLAADALAAVAAVRSRPEIDARR